MATSSSVLSQTLQSITAIKLRELQKQKQAFTTRKVDILQNAKGGDVDNIEALLLGLARFQKAEAEDVSQLQDMKYALWSAFGDAPPLDNIVHFLRQSKYDSSMPPALLPDIERSLRQTLDQRSEKFVYADLYSRLLTEWLQSGGTDDDVSAPTVADTASDTESQSDSGESYEVLERQKERLKQLSERFESVVFSPLETDTLAIMDLLSSFFEGEEATKALNGMRKRIYNFGKTLVSRSRPFDTSTLRWCIGGLLKSDLLSDQKKSMLEGFLKDDVVLTEIADVLNMRFADIESWSWDTEEGIAVEPRRQLNGKYRVIMDEDVLQSIFLHYVGTTWAIEFKAALKDLVSNPYVWRKAENMPRHEREKREYYLGKGGAFVDPSVSTSRHELFMDQFFLCQLPTNTVDDEPYHDEPKTSERTSVKQKLLHALAVELILNRALHQEVALVQSDLQWFATSTSHRTVDTLLKFFTVPTLWRKFFQQYLQAPLRMVGLEGESSEVRTRKRGVPINHVFQKLFGELIIFTMDMAVNKEAGMVLYRLHDDLWLCGSPAQCAKAWGAISHCANILGVEFNKAKTGSAYITGAHLTRDETIAKALPPGRVICGFLTLDAETGDWVIDQDLVDAHVNQLCKQLAECSSIFAWIQTYNSCIGRFFQNTFGQPANCFGTKHVDAILETHRRIQTALFNDSDSNFKARTVVGHLKSVISERFGVSNVADAFLYYPQELGGLGLRNPFIQFLVIRDQVLKGPMDRMRKFFEDEKHSYASEKKAFDRLSHRDRRKRLETIIGKESSYAIVNASTSSATPKKSKATASWNGPVGDDFFSIEEYREYRTLMSVDLRNAYDELMRVPHQVDISPTSSVLQQLKLGHYDNLAGNWNDLSSDNKWLLQQYGEEVIQRFGGLNLVDKTLLPMGVIDLLRSRKVVWQTVL